MKKKLPVILSLLGILTAAVFVALLLGGSRLAPGEIIKGILHPGAGNMATTILWKIRMPRIFLGLLVGMGLAVSGCIFQGILRNPLAEPYTLGISGGSAFGATLCTVSGLAAINVFFLPLCSYAGALCCMLLVYMAAARRKFSESTLILSGVILGVLFSSLVLFLFALTDAQKIQSAILWLMGDLSSADTGIISTAFLIIVPGVTILSIYGREIDILTLGDEKAAQLGLQPQKAKKILFVTASIVTAACVSASGVIGFVGLIIPHAVRKLTGPAHGMLIPASGLAGAAFLVICDALARTIISPMELPVGVITGIAGGVFFLGLIFRTEDRIF